MYLVETELESETLRQGDVISSTQILGAINPNNILRSVDGAGNAQAWSFKIPPINGPAMIVSHSCEIDRMNGVKLTSIVLCPLRDINKATAPEKVNELKETNFVNDSTKSSFLKYFYITPDHRLPYESGAVVDFSKCFSLHKSAYDKLLGSKILQLTNEAREKMALKLSLYYYRSQQPV